MTKYKLIKEIFSHPDIGIYTAYGIVVKENGYITHTISDITTSKKDLRTFCRLCNKLKLSPEHINEVVCDFICK